MDKGIIKSFFKLPVLFKVVFFIWICLQAIILIANWDFPNHDDALGYESLARTCIEENTLYPGVNNEYDLFIFGPGYVNLLILTHSIFGSFNFIKILNLILNIAFVFEVFILGRRIFDEKIGYLSAILYMLTYTNVYLPIAMLTDLPFTFLLVSALVLCTNSKNKLYYIIAGGMLLALANWFRPLAFVFLVVILVYFVINKYKWSHYVALLLPLLAVVLIIGSVTKSRTGYFNYQSVTGGFNLAMSSFDDANGLVNFTGIRDTANYVCIDEGHYTYQEYDSLYKAASIRWIKENPEKYIAQMPKKLFYLYCEDTWTERVKPDSGLSAQLERAKGNRAAYIEMVVILFSKSVVYYLILLLFLYYLFSNRLFQKKNVYILIPVLGTLVNLLFVITSRYHYPYMFVITIYAASGLYALTLKIKEKRVRLKDNVD